MGGNLRRRRSPLDEYPFIGACETCRPHSSTNTNPVRSSAPATITRQAALKNSSRSVAAVPLFSGEAYLPYGAREGGAADLHGGHRSEVLAPLLEGQKGTLSEALL